MSFLKGFKGNAKPNVFEDKYETELDSLEKIGEGKYGTVYLLNTAGTPLAVKIIQKNKLKSAQEKDFLQSEIQILQTLAEDPHPHILTFVEALEDKKRHFLILEYISGGELFDRIVQKQSYSEKETCEVIYNLSEALHFLHSQDIVHRDLKPENLLLVSSDSDTEIKIADFGFAKNCRDAPLVEGVGTLLYVAPEVLGGKEYKTEVDMWSLGIIMFVLLCGYPPFWDTNEAELSKKIMRGKTRFKKEDWSGVSKEAKDLLKVLMIRSQQKRFSAKEVLESQWIENREELEEQANEKIVVELRKFKARMMFAKAVNAVLAVNHMQKLIKENQEEMEENEFEEEE